MIEIGKINETVWESADRNSIILAAKNSLKLSRYLLGLFGQNSSNEELPYETRMKIYAVNEALGDLTRPKAAEPAREKGRAPSTFEPEPYIALEPVMPPIAELIENRLAALAIDKKQLVRRLGYKNVSKGLRRIDDIYAASQLSLYTDLISKLGAALEIPQVMVDAKIAATYQLLREHSENEYRVNFKPHAIALTASHRPSSLTIAAVAGADRRMKLALDLRQPPLTFVTQTLARLPNGIPGFGRVTGFVINYSLNEAVKYNLGGEPVEQLDRPVRMGRCEASF